MTTPDHIMPPPVRDTGPLETMARALQTELYGPNGCDEIPEGFYDRAKLAINALTEAGYAIVPVEPTGAMVDVGIQTECGLGPYALPQVIAASYRAMIAAAPPIDTKEGE